MKKTTSRSTSALDLKCPGCGVHPGHPDDLAPGVPFDDPPFCTAECRYWLMTRQVCAAVRADTEATRGHLAGLREPLTGAEREIRAARLWLLSDLAWNRHPVDWRAMDLPALSSAS
jgi:hypothetical protein